MGTANATSTPTTTELTNSRTVSTATLAGAAVGFVAFLILGLAPALYFGGFGGLLLAGALFGTPVPVTLLAQGLVVTGMALGVVAVGALFVVAGAFLGSMAAWLGLAVTGRTAAEEHDEG